MVSADHVGGRIRDGGARASPGGARLAPALRDAHLAQLVGAGNRVHHRHPLLCTLLDGLPVVAGSCRDSSMSGSFQACGVCANRVRGLHHGRE